MCTSLIHNGKKTIIGWNLDILDMEYRVTPGENAVYIEINDKTEGWMPLFGANRRGDFVAMPTCWPADSRSEPTDGSVNIINLDIDLLTEKRTFNETAELVRCTSISSVPGVTFQAQLTNKNGDVLQIVPGQGYNYYKKPKFSVMTNFSPFKGDSEKHPWMGCDRYETAVEALKTANDDFDVSDCFELLRKTSQTVCPTVVSMVYDAGENTVYWCEQRQWDNIQKQKMGEK